MSMEFIALIGIGVTVISTGVALAALILNTQRNQREEIKTLREDTQAGIQGCARGNSGPSGRRRRQNSRLCERKFRPSGGRRRQNSRPSGEEMKTEFKTQREETKTEFKTQREETKTEFKTQRGNN